MNEEIFMKLMGLVVNDKATLRHIFYSCWERYMEYLSDIASDIYDSCIMEYYKFKPKVYDRHGYPEGRNLYQANKISFNEYDIILRINEWDLWPYSGFEKRDRVLDTVMDGIRGGGARKLHSFKGWAKEWSTSYPNSYSRYGHVWSSGYSTINDILDDFIDTAIDSTYTYLTDLFYSSI